MRTLLIFGKNQRATLLLQNCFIKEEEEEKELHLDMSSPTAEQEGPCTKKWHNKNFENWSRLHPAVRHLLAA